MLIGKDTAVVDNELTELMTKVLRMLLEVVGVLLGTLMILLPEDVLEQITGGTTLPTDGTT